MGRLFFEDSTGDRILTAEGKLTIQDASLLKDLLMDAYSSPKRLLVDLTNTESLDLACIQLLCSANRTFRRAGKPMGLCAVPAGGVLRSLEVVAIDPASCDAELKGHCLWVTGGGDD